MASRDAGVVSVSLEWGRHDERVLVSHHRLERRGALTVGSDARADIVLPEAIVRADGDLEMGAAPHRLVEWGPAGVLVHAPPWAVEAGAGASEREREREGEGVGGGGGGILEVSHDLLAFGESRVFRAGEFTLTIARDRAQRFDAALFTADRAASLGGTMTSAALHATLLVGVAFFMPGLGDDHASIDREQLLSMRAFIDRAAERERDAVEQAANADAPGGFADPAPRKAGEEGALGEPTLRHRGSLRVSGDNRSERTLPTPKSDAHEARSFGMLALLGMLPTASGSATPSAWEALASGPDAETLRGALFGPPEPGGFGVGAGLSGIGEGGGGESGIIGFGDPSAIGRSLGLPGENGGPGGMGRCGASCLGIAGRTRHVAKGPTVRWANNITTNGRLPADVIQRIVRQNQGRFRACYEAGLTKNPSLAGRVTVRFVIGRDGGVSIAQDDGSELPDANVVACVVRSFQSLSFPAPSGGTVTVLYPLVLAPAE
jgi:hypothetical protein